MDVQCKWNAMVRKREIRDVVGKVGCYLATTDLCWQELGFLVLILNKILY